MNTYIARSLKYIIKMILLLGLIFVAMDITNTAALSGAALFTEIFMTTKGLLLIAALLVVAVAYPKFGFVKRDVKADLEQQRERIINVFAASGFVPTEQSNTKIVFRASTSLKRIMLSWDDAIEVTAEGNYITISGVRKEVVRIEFKLNSYLRDE